MSSHSGGTRTGQSSWHKLYLRIPTKWNNPLLKGKVLKLAAQDASEVPGPRDHASIIVGIAHVLDTPGRSRQLALTETTGFVHDMTIMSGWRSEYQ